MHNIYRMSLLVTAATVMNVAASVPVIAASLYSVTDLGTLDGGTVDRFDTAYGINNRGAVVGAATTSQGNRAFGWTQAGGIKDLGVLGSDSVARDVNDKNQIVGSTTIDNTLRAFVRDADGRVQNLGAVGARSIDGLSSSYANGINNQGLVVGATTTRDNLRGFVWERNGGMQELGVLGTSTKGIRASVANDVNSKDEIVGDSTVNNRAGNYAFLRTAGGQLQNLGVLGSNGAGESYSTAYAINDSSQVVGSTSVSGSDRTGSHAFLWQSGKGMQDLGVLGFGANGIRNSTAYDINNKGQVVGQSTIGGGQAAFLWDNGVMRDLNKLLTGGGWFLSEAQGINDVGEIIGRGSFNGQERAFRLTPQAGKDVRTLSPGMATKSAVLTASVVADNAAQESVPEPANVWGLLVLVVLGRKVLSKKC